MFSGSAFNSGDFDVRYCKNQIVSQRQIDRDGEDVTRYNLQASIFATCGSASRSLFLYSTGSRFCTGLPSK